MYMINSKSSCGIKKDRLATGQEWLGKKLFKARENSVFFLFVGQGKLR